MNGLHYLQNKFQAYLLDADPCFQNEVVATENVPAETRLAIYRDAYSSRLIEALANNYSILQLYLGCEQFETLGQAYLLAYPSSYRSIRWFGDQLAPFLRTHASYKDRAYLAELAQFEWTLTLVFDAEDSTVLPIAEMSKVPPAAWINMRFVLHPSVYRLNLRCNVVQIWNAISEKKIPPVPIEATEAVHWVLWRKGFINQFCSLAEDEAWAIDAILAGSMFIEMCEGLCQWINEEEAGIRAASLLKGWITEGFISKIIFEN